MLLHLHCTGVFFRKKQSSEYKGSEIGHMVIANGASLDYQVECIIRVLLTFSVNAKHGQMLALKRKREQKWIDVSRPAAKRSADTMLTSSAIWGVLIQASLRLQQTYRRLYRQEPQQCRKL